jgi:hypothetical protein
MDFPQPLYESCILTGPRLCLVCARNVAATVLRTTDRDVCPLCLDCGADWNVYGYAILRRIKPLTLFRNIGLFKLTHWGRPSVATVWKDVTSLRQWGEQMRKFRHLL